MPFPFWIADFKFLLISGRLHVADKPRKKLCTITAAFLLLELLYKVHKVAGAVVQLEF